MHKEDKERVVSELTERLRSAETLIVADYRGLTMPQIDALRGKLLENGARLTVVKNTLTRRAAEAAGADALLALLEGPSAIAFIESEGDAAAVAKALSDSARETRVLAIRGGVMRGRQVGEDEIEALAKLPPIDILRGQVLGIVIAPLTQMLALLNAPVQNLLGLIDARIEQLRAQGDTGAPVADEQPAEESPAAEAATAEAEVRSVEEEAVGEMEAPAPEAGSAADADGPAAEAAADPQTTEPEARAEAPAEESSEPNDQEV
jgi:large subunit ribosomal protein L10